MTPMEVADRLDALAAETADGVNKLRPSSRSDKELAATLIDMEAFANLGRYYADKIRGAAELAVYRADPVRSAAHAAAVGHFKNAVKEWEAYAAVATRAYHPQLYSRVHYMDWDRILDQVKREVATVQARGD